MARAIGRLTALKVEKAKKPGMYADGGGLYLRVTAEGTRNWVLRYMIDRRPRWMGLGPFPLYGLQEARAKALDARRKRHEGIDPIEARRAERARRRLADAKATTFKECAESYISAHRAGWRNAKHAAQWETTLATHAAAICDLPVQAIDTALVLKVLEPIWATKPETASRVRGRIESILDWARVRGYREGENPARWKGHLDKLLPARGKVRAVRHHPAAHYGNIPALMEALRNRHGISARALEFTILTAARTEAVIGAIWDEVDMDEAVWTVPPSRTGTKISGDKPRRVPLSEPAMAILRALPRVNGNPHIFAGDTRRGSLSNMAMAEQLKEFALPSTTPGRMATVHGMRSTFKDWTSECTRYENHVSEAALWHVVSDKVEAAYRRGDVFEKRRRLMQQWATFCTAEPVRASRGNVAPIRQVG